MTLKNWHFLIKWMGITFAVMLLLPFAVARFASADSGMVLCVMLFLVLNPVYSVVLGINCGKNISHMWSIPLFSAIMFLAGAWLCFDTHEPWFILYASVYLAVGWIVMLVTHCVNAFRKRKGNG